MFDRSMKARLETLLVMRSEVESCHSQIEQSQKWHKSEVDFAKDSSLFLRVDVQHGVDLSRIESGLDSAKILLCFEVDRGSLRRPASVAARISAVMASYGLLIGYSHV
jgi:hypothetical protein